MAEAVHSNVWDWVRIDVPYVQQILDLWKIDPGKLNLIEIMKNSMAQAIISKVWCE